MPYDGKQQFLRDGKAKPVTGGGKGKNRQTHLSLLVRKSVAVTQGKYRGKLLGMATNWGQNE